jgi:hypothetical protein
MQQKTSEIFPMFNLIFCRIPLTREYGQKKTSQDIQSTYITSIAQGKQLIDVVLSPTFRTTLTPIALCTLCAFQDIILHVFGRACMQRAGRGRSRICLRHSEPHCSARDSGRNIADRLQAGLANSNYGGSYLIQNNLGVCGAYSIDGAFFNREQRHQM